MCDLGVGAPGSQESKDFQLPLAQRVVELPGRGRSASDRAREGFEGCIRCIKAIVSRGGTLIPSSVRSFRWPLPARSSSTFEASSTVSEVRMAAVVGVSSPRSASASRSSRSLFLLASSLFDTAPDLSSTPSASGCRRPEEGHDPPEARQGDEEHAGEDEDEDVQGGLPVDPGGQARIRAWPPFGPALLRGGIRAASAGSRAAEARLVTTESCLRPFPMTS